MTHYWIIRPEGAPERVECPDLPEKPDYGFFKSQIAPLVGGWLERVAVKLSPEDQERFAAAEYTDMFVDEEGLRKRNMINETATWLYRGPGHRHNEIIVGTAVLFSRRVWF